MQQLDSAVSAATGKLPWFPWISKKRPFYGWVIVFIGAMTQFNQGIVSQGFATYLVPLQEQFGWSRAVLAGPRSVMQVENAILGPLEGFFIDKYGPRSMVAVGSLIMGLGLIFFGLTNSLWLYYLSNIIVAIGGGLAGLLIMSVTVNHWFRRKRTMANAVMGLGFAAAGVVGVPMTVFVQTTVGWRTAAMLTGIIVWIVGISLSIFLRRNPERYGLMPDGDAIGIPVSTGVRSGPPIDEYDFTLREAMRTRAFWLVAIGPAIGQLGMAAAGIHLFLHLEQGVGLSRGMAAMVWSVASMTNIPSRLIGGFFGDRLPKRIVLGAAMVMMAASQFILGIATSLPLALAYAVLYGISWGARTPIMNAMQGEYFGRRSQGTIRGWLSVVSLPLTIAAPVVVGYLADTHQGSYRSSFVVLSFVGLAGAALVFAAAPPQPPSTAQTRM